MAVIECGACGKLYVRRGWFYKHFWLVHGEIPNYVDATVGASFSHHDITIGRFL